MARKEVGLTDAKVAAISAPKSGRVEVWDSLCPGLKLRVGTKSKVWYMWGRVKAPDGSTPYQTKIGPYSRRHLGIAEARARGRDIQDAADQGIHPTRAKIAERELAAEKEQQEKVLKVSRDRGRFSSVADAYISDYAKPRNKTWAEDQRILDYDCIPVFGDRVMDEIETAEVRDFLLGIRDRARASSKSATGEGYFIANRTLAVLRKIFNWAIVNGYASRTPIATGMALGDEKQKSRKRSFEDEEVRAIWSACEELPVNAGAAVRMLILSGQRLSVVAGMRHSELNIEEGTWTIPGDAEMRAKSGLDHVVPLTSQMIELINNVPHVDGIDHVFCSHRRGDKRLQIGSKYKNVLDQACGFSDWTFQSLRGLVVTRMRRKPLQIDRDIVDLVEGRLPDTVQRKNYDSYDYFDEKLDALQRWNDLLFLILDESSAAAGNVVQLKPSV